MFSKFPKQIKYIIGNEAAERYSFYGMRSILVIYMVTYLLIDKTSATTTYHLFVGACYLFPLLGAFISDILIGKYKTIIALSIVYTIGQFTLAFFNHETGLYWGLMMIALGSGGIKPCVSAFVGDQFKKGQGKELRQVFNIFYFSINFGSFFSTLITPWTLPLFGPKVAFGIPGVLMAIATLIFWSGRKHYSHLPPTGRTPHGTIAILLSAIRNRTKGVKFLDGALKNHKHEHVDAVKAAFAVAGTFATIAIFWAMFDQHGSTWILQAREMDLLFMGITFLPSQIAALNPIMVMLLIPISIKIIYPAVEKLGIELTPLRKMGAGMFITAISFAMIAAIQYALDSGVRVNVAWQFFPYLTITLAEILISITGLEFAYTQAPRSMKSTIMSFWLLTVFLGNMFTAVIAKINPFTEGVHFFSFFTIINIVIAFIFVYVAKRYKMRDFMETE